MTFCCVTSPVDPNYMELLVYWIFESKRLQVVVVFDVPFAAATSFYR